MSFTSSAAVCTWFVEDGPDEATFFPQMGESSDSSSAQARYWKCAVGFFATSLHVNPNERHVMFTNAALPTLDGVHLSQVLDRWGVEVVSLPISYRLPRSVAQEWGNQFYIFDILDYLASTPLAPSTVVLDSDCVWLRPVSGIVSSLSEYDVLGYRMGDVEYPNDASINGLTRQQLALFLAANGGPSCESIDYFGGEFFAARNRAIVRLVEGFHSLWPAVLRRHTNAPLEEAHMLSILYALTFPEVGSANDYIRRMWTTFKHNNLSVDDRRLTVWHLPAEKKSGFEALYRWVIGQGPLHPVEMDLSPERLGLLMGYPRRSLRKLIVDARSKVLEHLGP